MMQLKKREFPHRKQTVVFVLIILVGCALATYAYSAKLLPFNQQRETSETNNTTSNSPSNSQQSTGSLAKEEVANRSTLTPSDSSDGSIPVVITAIQPGDTVLIRTTIGIVATEGTCVLDMNGPNGKTYRGSTGIQAMSSTSTCKGFNVPLSELSSGKWTITISVKSAGAYGSATAEATL